MKALKLLGKVMAAGTLAVVLGTALAGTAHADNWHHDSWRYHELHARRWHVHHRRPVPHVVYAPPVIYTPPPQPVAPGFNLIVPLHIH